MISEVTQLKNPSGLHARPASEFVACARRFKSRIRIKRYEVGEEDEVDAKSIVMLLSLGIAAGEEIQIRANGEDEVEAVDALVNLINSGFGEAPESYKTGDDELMED